MTIYTFPVGASKKRTVILQTMNEDGEMWGRISRNRQVYLRRNEKDPNSWRIEVWSLDGDGPEEVLGPLSLQAAKSVIEVLDDDVLPMLEEEAKRVRIKRKEVEAWAIEYASKLDYIDWHPMIAKAWADGFNEGKLRAAMEAGSNRMTNLVEAMADVARRIKSLGEREILS